MTKFDLTFTKLSENFGINQNNNQQQNNTQTNTNTQQPNTPNQSTNNNQQKPNLDQLMKDFNDPNKKIASLDDLKNYGIIIDKK